MRTCTSKRENAGLEYEYDPKQMTMYQALDEFCGPESTWQTTRSRDALTEEAFYVAWTDAVEHDLEDADDGTPALGVICEGGNLGFEVWLGGEFIAGSSRHGFEGAVRVLHRFDDDNLVDDPWEDEPNRRFAVLSEWQHASFLRSLRSSETLVFPVWNYDDTVIGTMTFDLAGVERDVEPVLRECGY